MSSCKWWDEMKVERVGCWISLFMSAKRRIASPREHLDSIKRPRSSKKAVRGQI